MNRSARVFSVVILLCLPIARAQSADSQGLGDLPEDVRRAYHSIRGDRMMPTIRFLASPRLEGREGGERGAEIAADYLVSRFQAAGLRAGSREGFLQRFDLVGRILAPEVELTMTRRAGDATTTRSLRLQSEWIPLGFSEVGSVEAPVAFGGYGIVAPEYDWDDYAALGSKGVRGKAVVLFRHEPDEEGQRGRALFEGREMTLHASLRQKARVAFEMGALAVIVVDDPANHEPAPNPSSSLARWTILTDEERELPRDDTRRPRGRVGIEQENRPLGILAALGSQEILRWLDPRKDWKSLQQDMDGSGKSKAFVVPHVTLQLVHRFEEDRRPTNNVIAMLPGSDPGRSEEYVLIGGHYDHVGKDDETGEVYPGADDNASGMATVLAVAEAFASLPDPPARSLLFVGWGAEEKGLLGSAHFVRNPPVPLEKIVAAVNLDMVGRNKEGEMSVVGRTETPDLVSLFDRFAPAVGFELNDDAGAGASRSDNSSMWLGAVPTVSLFSGTHEDYHEPGDTAEKVLPGKIEKAARLTFLVAHEIASGRATPEPLEVPTGPWEPIAPPREAGEDAR